MGVAPLIDDLAFEGFIADKAFDSNSIIADLNERGAKIVVSQHPRRASSLSIREIYKWRHLIENFFGNLKEFKRVAMRADKTDQSFAALSAAIISIIQLAQVEIKWPILILGTKAKRLRRFRLRRWLKGY